MCNLQGNQTQTLFVLPVVICVTLARSLPVIKTFEPLVLYSVRVFLLSCSIFGGGWGVSPCANPSSLCAFQVNAVTELFLSLCCLPRI